MDDKIIEISLAKIERCKLKKVSGKSSTLHKSLLVNSLLNRVRCGGNTSDKKDPLMNYREPKCMEVDDFEMDKIPPFLNISIARPAQQHCIRKQSSLVTKLNSRSLGVSKQELKGEFLVTPCSFKEGKVKSPVILCECEKDKKLTKRSHTDPEEDSSPPKRVCKNLLWPTDVNPKYRDSPNYSITSLASLFGDLVAHSEVDSERQALGNSFTATQMIAC